MKLKHKTVSKQLETVLFQFHFNCATVLGLAVRHLVLLYRYECNLKAAVSAAAAARAADSST